MKNPSPEELERMAEARQASLIRKWLSGRKLSPEEKSEIAHLLPPHILAQGPSGPDARKAVKGALSTRKHVKYRQKLPYYATFFGQTERTVKRWIRRGKELDNLPPLDEPTRMAAWWRGAMDHQVPDKLLGVLGNNKTPPDLPRASSVDAGSSGDTAPRDFSGVISLDLAQNVAGLRRTHAINKQLLDEALQANPPNDTLTQLRQKNFERSFDLLRVAEMTLLKFQKDASELIDRESVRAELSHLLESLQLMRETMPRRIIIELEKIISQSGSDRRFQRVLRMLEQSLAPAIEKARTQEENIFRNLELLNGPEDIQKLLAA